MSCFDLCVTQNSIVFLSCALGSTCGSAGKDNSDCLAHKSQPGAGGSGTVRDDYREGDSLKARFSFVVSSEVVCSACFVEK